MITVAFLFVYLTSIGAGLLRGAFVAGVFGLHPLNVDAVAWLPGRNETLGTLFAVVSLLAYSRYAVQRRRLFLIGAFCCFVGGVLSYPPVAILPFLWIVLDFWASSRWEASQRESSNALVVVREEALGKQARKMSVQKCDLPQLLIEKWPAVAISAALVIVAIVAESRNAGMVPAHTVPISVRIGGIAAHCVSCLVRALMPYGISMDELYSGRHALAIATIALAVLLGISAWAVLRAREYPFIIVGWLWYVGSTLLTVSLSRLGDRPITGADTYFSLIGLCVAIVWLVPCVVQPGPMRTWLIPAVGIVNVVIFAAVTRAEVTKWHNRVELIDSELRSALIPDGVEVPAASGSRKMIDSIAHVEAALRWPPPGSGVYESMAFALQELDRPSEAAKNYEEAIALEEERPLAHYNLALILLQREDRAAAERHLWRALELDPRLPWPYVGLGQLCLARGEGGEAERYFARALELGGNGGGSALEPQRPQADNSMTHPSGFGAGLTQPR